jgi:hypothetical protein
MGHAQLAAKLTASEIFASLPVFLARRGALPTMQKLQNIALVSTMNGKNSHLEYITLML